MAQKIDKLAHKSPYNYSTDHSQRQLSPSSQGSPDASFEIQPKMRAKQFRSPQDKPRLNYDCIRNKQREPCKNYLVKGYCKYMDQCAFSHDKDSLLASCLAPTNYKTKPCKRYFSFGCQYGERCQYLHYEAIDVLEYRDYIEKLFRQAKLMVPMHPNKLVQKERSDVQRFQHLYKIFGRKLEFRRDDLWVNCCKKRLDVFRIVCEEEIEFTEQFEQLLMSNGNSRKVSANGFEKF